MHETMFDVMDATMVAVTRDEQLCYIKIEFLRGKSPLEIYSALQEVCPTTALPYSTICRRLSQMKSPREPSPCKTSPGKESSATDDVHIQMVRDLLNSDRRLTCDEIARELGISHGSAYSIITKHLGMRKLAARWVPHNLSDSEMDTRAKICRQHMRRYNTEQDNFLDRIVTIDETWIRSFEPELKRQSNEWHTPSSPRPVKFRRSLNNPKMLMIFAYDIHGVLTSHRVPTGRTINKEYYKTYLRTVLRPAIRKKRPDLLAAGPLILHDNASCHKADVVNTLLEEYKWEVLKHPPYSPDLSPCDFDLFPKLKEPLRGIRYTDLDELEEAVATEVRRITRGCLATGIRGLPRRWESVIKAKGGYFEGQ